MVGLRVFLDLAVFPFNEYVSLFNMDNTNSFSFGHRRDLVSNDSALFTEERVFHKIFTETG